MPKISPLVRTRNNFDNHRLKAWLKAGGIGPGLNVAQKSCRARFQRAVPGFVSAVECRKKSVDRTVNAASRLRAPLR